MKNIIFSIYIKNTDKKPSRKHDNTRKQLDRHLVRLLKNHKEYAKKCNADYKVFVDDEKWLEASLYAQQFALMNPQHSQFNEFNEFNFCASNL